MFGGFIMSCVHSEEEEEEEEGKKEDKVNKGEKC